MEQPIIVEFPKSLQNREIIAKVTHVSRIYELGASRVTALRDISMEIPKGVLVALKGRSGSGKTTLLNIIGGLDTPTQGDVELFGVRLSQLDAESRTELRRQRLGFVFQSFAILPIFSAVENVELMLRIANIQADRRTLAMRALEIVGLGPWANHRPWELSGGQQQRVAIARALATRPELVIADEPTGELDSTTGRQIMALFRFIAVKEAITVLMATHDPLIEEYAHMVVDLTDGQIRSIRFPSP